MVIEQPLNTFHTVHTCALFGLGVFSSGSRDLGYNNFQFVLYPRHTMLTYGGPLRSCRRFGTRRVHVYVVDVRTCRSEKKSAA